MVSVPVLLTLVVGGLATILLYVLLLPQVLPGGSFDALWFGIDGWVRTLYLVSIALAAVAFLGVAGWLLSPAATDASRVVPALTVFFVGAVLWSVLLWVWGQTGRGRAAAAAVVGALTLTTAGAVWLLVELVRRMRAPVWVVVLAAFIVFHVGALDNVGWSVAFLCDGSVPARI